MKIHSSDYGVIDNHGVLAPEGNYLEGSIDIVVSQQARSESPNPSPSSTQWFVKVVSSLCIRHPHSLAILNSDYFRYNLDPCVAYGVIYLLNRMDDPSLACSFFTYSRHNLNVEHSESTFDLLLRSLCRANLIDLAKTVYEYARADRIRLDKSRLNHLIKSFSEAGKFGIAEDILITRAELSNQKKLTISPFVYNIFLSLLISRNQLEKAVAFFRDHILKSPAFRPDHFTFNIMIRGMCVAGQVEKAFEIFAIMESFGCRPDLVTYNTLINGLCRVGNADGAWDLLRKLQYQLDFSPDSVSYTSVISGYCKLGKMEYAESLFDEMLDYGIKPDVYTFNAIIDGFAKIGNMTSALKIYERMVSSGIFPNAVTFTCLMGGYSRLGEFYECIKILDEMNKRNVSPTARTCSVIVNALCKRNRLNEACSFLRKLNGMHEVVLQPRNYNPVIDLLCKAGRVDEANVIVSEMEANGCIHDVMTYTILILGHCMGGRMFEAVRIYSKMLLVGCAPDNIIRNSFVKFLRKAGMAHEANVVENSGQIRSSSSSERSIEYRLKFSIPLAA